MKKWTSETAKAVREATGLDDPVEGAILLAEQFTLDSGIDNAAESLDILASFLEAKIQTVPLGKEAGQLVPPASNDEPYLILVNEAHPLKRRNFSACHEMGHLLMPNYSPKRGTLRDWDSMRFNPQHEEEFLCDVAAAEILLPRRLFKPRLQSQGLSIDTVFQLAGEFGASLEATLLHVVLSSGADVAGMVWELDYDNEDAAKALNGTLNFGPEYETVVEKKWRVVKSWTSGAMKDFYFPRRRSADAQSPTAQAGEAVAIGRTRAVGGIQVLKPGCGEQEFYVESRGYSFRKQHDDTELTTKVLSLVWLDRP